MVTGRAPWWSGSFFMIIKHLRFRVLATVLFCSCGKPAAKDYKLVDTPGEAAEQQPAAVKLTFNADSAYVFV